MIEIRVHIDYLNTLVNRYAKLLDTYGIRNMRITKDKVDFFYLVDLPLFGKKYVKINLKKFGANPNGTEINFDISVPDFGELLSNKAADNFVDFLKTYFPDASHHGGTIKIPVTKWIAGISVLLVDELVVNLRVK